VCSSRLTASWPATIAEVLAVFAVTQDRANTLTVRHTIGAGSPRAGSMMWWQAAPARVQLRVTTLDVAIAPSRIATVWAVSLAGAR
jgi:hypothetical protein